MTAKVTVSELTQVLRDARLLIGVSGPEDTLVEGVVPRLQVHPARCPLPGLAGLPVDGHGYLEQARRPGRSPP